MTSKTYLKILIIALFITQGKAFAQTYPVYLCGTSASVTLVPNAVINTGDRIVWVETTGGVNTEVQNSTSPNFVTPAGLSVGEHSYQVHIISAAPAGCAGDPSDEYKIYQLPSTTITLAAPTLANYCSVITPAASSAIVATSTPGQTLPQDVTYAYTWTATKGGTAVADVTTIGSVSTSSNTLTNTFTLNTTSVGVYALTASSKYVVPTGSTLKSSDGQGCVNTTTPETVTVSPQPAKPTITFL